MCSSVLFRPLKSSSACYVILRLLSYYHIVKNVLQCALYRSNITQKFINIIITVSLSTGKVAVAELAEAKAGDVIKSMEGLVNEAKAKLSITAKGGK